MYSYLAQGVNHFNKSKGGLIHFECPAQIVNSPAAILGTCNYFLSLGLIRNEILLSLLPFEMNTTNKSSRQKDI
jgi:hypothetical protein